MTKKTSYQIQLETELASFIDPGTGILSAEKSSLISCPICNSPDHEHRELFFKRGYRFVLCQSCSLIFTNPAVDRTLNRQLYDNAASLQEWARILQTEEQYEFDTGTYNAIRALADNYMPKHPSCLDISMRGGSMENIPSFTDWNIDYLDFSLPSRELGQSRHPEKKFYSDFDEARLEGKTYDAVISFEAIEQFTDPVEFALNVKALLKKGGIFCGVLSSTESLLVRVLQEKAPLFDGLYQKFFFHTASLERLFRKCCLTSLDFKTMPTGKDMLKSTLNIFIPEKTTVLSEGLIDKVADLADETPFGYKLIFAAQEKLHS